MACCRWPDGFFVPDGLRETVLERSLVMAKKRFSAEQIVTLLRQIEVAMGQGRSTPLACREAGIEDVEIGLLNKVQEKTELHAFAVC
jgi:hypothetical protein